MTFCRSGRVFFVGSVEPQKEAARRTMCATCCRYGQRRSVYRGEGVSWQLRSGQGQDEDEAIAIAKSWPAGGVVEARAVPE